MSDRPPPGPTAAGADPVSELLYRWDRDRQAGVEVTPEDLCRDTPELLAEVTRRVRALEAMYGVPNRPDDTAPNDAGPDADRPRVAGYEVGDELGRGGMGVVWKATDTRLNRPVALKVLPAGGATAAARARFRVEAEAAAGLVHPHIVQVYEVGEAGGRPYLALEYVPGGSLADRLAAGPLPPADAAGLIETVARAVDHAHKHGVLHRDLKPANILLAGVRGQETGGSRTGAEASSLTPDSRLLTPKVGDFGLAKRLGADAGATRTGDVLGTPAYMAPEQAAGRAAGVGVAADVYGLGAVLYATLTGRPPFDAGSALETLDQVVNREPVPPSKLRPGCPRDLDVICLKCLRKDPGKRYASAADLADDLRRWRVGEPIAARPVRPPERLWLWARRRPAPAALSAALVLVAAGSVAGLTALYLEARRQRDVAEDRRKDAEEAQARAEFHAEEADVTVAFLARDVFAAARPRPHGGLGEDVTVVRAVDAALPRIEAAFAGHPTAEATLRDTLADLYNRVGNYRAAVAQLERCVALRREHDPGNPTTDRTRHKLANAYRRAGRRGEAEALLREVLARQAAAGADHPHVAETENALAHLLLEADRPAEAEPLLAHALRVRVAEQGEDGPAALECLFHLAMARADLGRLDEAEGMVRRCAAGHARTNPAGHHRSDILSGLADLLVRRGRPADALAEAQQALDLRRAGLAADHPQIAFSENQVGMTLWRLGRADEAEGHLRRAYDRLGRRADGDPAARVPYGNNLARVLVEQGRASEAEPVTREVLAAARPAGARVPLYLAAALFHRAECLLALGWPGEAVPLAREAREVRAKALPPGDVNRAAADNLLGACLTETGDLAAAEPLLVSSQKALADHPAARPAQRRAAAGRLARYYEKAGRPADAAAWRAE